MQEKLAAAQAHMEAHRQSFLTFIVQAAEAAKRGATGPGKAAHLNEVAAQSYISMMSEQGCSGQAAVQAAYLTYLPISKSGSGRVDVLLVLLGRPCLCALLLSRITPCLLPSPVSAGFPGT